MNNSLLEKLRPLIMGDTIFNQKVRDLPSGQEEDIVKLLEIEGIKASYEAFKEAFLRLMTEHSYSKEMDIPMSDDELELVVGGANTTCFNRCVDITLDPDRCQYYCLRGE